MTHSLILLESCVVSLHYIGLFNIDKACGRYSLVRKYFQIWGVSVVLVVRGLGMRLTILVMPHRLDVFSLQLLGICEIAIGIIVLRVVSFKVSPTAKTAFTAAGLKTFYLQSECRQLIP